MVGDVRSAETRYEGIHRRKNQALAIASVEGLRLTPESAERLERNKTLSSEERRAETIKAFTPKTEEEA